MYEVLFSCGKRVARKTTAPAYYYTCGYECEGIENCFVNPVFEGFSRRGKNENGAGLKLSTTGMAEVDLKKGEIKNFKAVYAYEDGY